MNNYADYAATQLQYYGLKPDSAEYDAKEQYGLIMLLVVILEVQITLIHMPT